MVFVPLFVDTIYNEISLTLHIYVNIYLLNEWIFHLQKHIENAMAIHNIYTMWHKTGNREQYNNNIHVVANQ